MLLSKEGERALRIRRRKGANGVNRRKVASRVVQVAAATRILCLMSTLADGDHIEVEWMDGEMCVSVVHQSLASCTQFTFAR